MIEASPPPFYSVVPGSTVISNRTVELVKTGRMFTLQTVIEGITVDTTKDFLFNPTAFSAGFLVVYEIMFKVSQGKGIGQFFAGGTYSGGSGLTVLNRNENAGISPVTVITEDPTVSVLGTGGFKYMAGGEAQGNNLAGGGGGDQNFPLEVNPAVDRIFRLIQSGGSGTYDLELRLVFAEIP